MCAQLGARSSSVYLDPGFVVSGIQTRTRESQEVREGWTLRKFSPSPIVSTPIPHSGQLNITTSALAMSTKF